MYLYQQLQRDIEDKIHSGQWPMGMRLPSIRQLCLERKLSKATVIHTYQRLEAMGLIEARFKSGFYVAATLKQRLKPSKPKVDVTPQLVDTSDLMRDIMEHSSAFDICPHIGSRDTAGSSMKVLNRALARALRRQKAQEHAYYDEPAGLLALRKVISERYNRLGCSTTTDDVVITAGCQHALSLALQACCQPGDTVAVESPGFYGVLQLIESMGLKALEIPVLTDTGLSIGALTKALQSWSIKACVVTPAFTTPTGALMPRQSREKLLALAQQYDFKVIEDDIYGDLAFQQRPSPLKQLDQDDRVMLCGSFSKSLSRELRLGWLITTDQRPIKRQKMVNLLALPKYTQQGIADFINDGEYDKHLRRQRLALQAQKDHLLALLDLHWRKLGPIRISEPVGGLTLWLELGETFDVVACYLKAREQGVLITPGNLFTAQARYSNCLRLSFAHRWDEQRERSLIILADLLLASQRSLERS